MSMTYEVGNSSPVLGQAPNCGGVKPVNDRKMCTLATR